MRQRIGLAIGMIVIDLRGDLGQTPRGLFNAAESSMRQ